MRKVQYFTEQEKQGFIEEATANGEILIEEANLLDGEFLTFGTVGDIPPTPEPTKLELLQADLDATKETLNFVLMNF